MGRSLHCRGTNSNRQVQNSATSPVLTPTKLTGSSLAWRTVALGTTGVGAAQGAISQAQGAACLIRSLGG